jgi:hypothetical protein
MLRMYVAQQCLGLSDEGIEDAIYDSQSIRAFVLLLVFKAIGSSVVVSRLAMMQTDGLLTAGGAFVIFLVAMTSLLHARARAAVDGTGALPRNRS